MKQAKKILVPTDLSVKSLQIVREAVEQNTDAELEIVLACGALLPDSITDLLFLSKRKMIADLQTQEFVEACKIIKSKYSTRIQNMYVDVLTSSNGSYVQSYLKGAKIDEVVIPVNYNFTFKNSSCFSVLPKLKKHAPASFEVIMPKESVATYTETNNLSDLFLNPLELTTG